MAFSIGKTSVLPCCFNGIRAGYRYINVALSQSKTSLELMIFGGQLPKLLKVKICVNPSNVADW